MDLRRSPNALALDSLKTRCKMAIILWHVVMKTMSMAFHLEALSAQKKRSFRARFLELFACSHLVIFFRWQLTFGLEQETGGLDCAWVHESLFFVRNVSFPKISKTSFSNFFNFINNFVFFHFFPKVTFWVQPNAMPSVPSLSSGASFAVPADPIVNTGCSYQLSVFRRFWAQMRLWACWTLTSVDSA